MRTETLPFRAAPAGPPVGPDPAFAARPALLRLRDDLRAAASVRAPRRPWREPPVFFFDAARQAELDAARGPNPPAERHPLDARIATELPTLIESVEVRRTARTIPGLREAAATLASRLPAAKDLADLLAVPDDEVVVALDPAHGVGARVLVRGVAGVAEFHLLLADTAPDLSGRPRPAAEPGVGVAHWQLYRPAALRPDGSLPAGMSGYEHWFWGADPLAAVPLADGERVVLLGPPAYPAAWDIEPRFPDLAASATLLEELAPVAVAARLGRLLGRPVPARADRPGLARAA
ncbi:MAG TPA: hypothetical protein VH092_19120 [Urbifossiella sp.]|nr:hypothetical protein [Urbifossiella sp.]